MRNPAQCGYAERIFHNSGTPKNNGWKKEYSNRKLLVHFWKLLIEKKIELPKTREGNAGENQTDGRISSKSNERENGIKPYYHKVGFTCEIASIA